MCFLNKKMSKKRSFRPPHPHPRGSQFFLLRWRGAQFRKKRRKKAGEEVLALLLLYTDCCWHPRFLKNGRGKKNVDFFSLLYEEEEDPPTYLTGKRRGRKKIYFPPPPPSIYLFLLPVWKMSPGFLPLIPPPPPFTPRAIGHIWKK